MANKTQKVLILLDADPLSLKEQVASLTKWGTNSLLISELQADGSWAIVKIAGTTNNRWAVRETQIPPYDLLDIFTLVAQQTDTDINTPNMYSPVCICPKTCCCCEPPYPDPECPVHNEHPLPSPDCPQHNPQI